MLHNKIRDARDTNRKIYSLADQFITLKQSDYDVMLKKVRHQNLGSNKSPDELYLDINRMIEDDINQVMHKANEEMKADDKRNDILSIFYALLTDDALVRLRFFKF